MRTLSIHYQLSYVGAAPMLHATWYGQFHADNTLLYDSETATGSLKDW
jgi:hypothetical protein